MNTNQRRYTMHLYVTTLCFVSAGGGIAWILAESEKGARRLRSPTHPGPGINQSEMVHPSSGPDSSLENDTRCGRDRWHVQIPGARAPPVLLSPAGDHCLPVHGARRIRQSSRLPSLSAANLSTRGRGIHLLLPTQVTAGTHDWLRITVQRPRLAGRSCSLPLLRLHVYNLG